MSPETQSLLVFAALSLLFVLYALLVLVDVRREIKKAELKDRIARELDEETTRRETRRRHHEYIQAAVEQTNIDGQRRLLQETALPFEQCTLAQKRERFMAALSRMSDEEDSGYRVEFHDRCVCGGTTGRGLTCVYCETETRLEMSIHIAKDEL